MRKPSRRNKKANDTRGSQNKNRKTLSKKFGSHHTAALTVATDQMHGTRHFKVDQFGWELRGAQVPATLRDLAERNISQTRAIYERSKDTIHALLLSWNKSFGAVNQGAVALNLKVIDIAERNISTGFDFAMNLAGAKNLAEAMEIQSAYWRKQLDQLQAHAEEVKTLLSQTNENVTGPIEAQMKRVGASSSRPLRGK
jgi:hypothetical protein